jgi:hypothetical protein
MIFHLKPRVSFHLQLPDSALSHQQAHGEPQHSATPDGFLVIPVFSRNSPRQNQ